MTVYLNCAAYKSTLLTCSPEAILDFIAAEDDGEEVVVTVLLG